MLGEIYLLELASTESCILIQTVTNTSKCHQHHNVTHAFKPGQPVTFTIMIIDYFEKQYLTIILNGNKN